MKVLRHPRRGQNRHRQRFQVVIQRFRQTERVPILAQIAMGDLGERVHPGIGAPGPGDRWRVRLQFAERRFQRLLHGRLVFLPLPADERPAVILDFECVSWHDLPIARALRSGKRALWRNITPALMFRTTNPGAGTLVFSDMADRLTRGMDTVQSTVSEAFFEPVIRLGVTGLSGAGKTVFITSLVANLIDRARMVQLLPAANGAIRAAYLRPQPDDTVARFDYEGHLGALLAGAPAWPDSTRAVSELRLSLRVQPTGILGAVSGPRTVHIDIVDYPGEWLLDLALLGKSYAKWSADTFARLAGRAIAADYLAQAGGTDGAAQFDELTAKSLAQSYTGYLTSAKAAGYSDCTPGRFSLPGDLAGSPVLTFAPLKNPERARRGTLWREMQRRFEAYKSKVVRPFFRDHFARIDRQIVLVDVLGAIHAGPKAFGDLRRAMAEILGAFRPGRNAILSKLLLGKRVEKILFAATKADHLHHRQHPQLTAIMEALMKDARARADFKGAGPAAMSIAALRATVEQTIDHNGAALDCVRGTLASGKQAAFFAGELPVDPTHLLGAARDGAEKWLDADYQCMSFAPARLRLLPGEGPPHIRLDRAAQYLIGDRL